MDTAQYETIKRNQEIELSLLSDILIVLKKVAGEKEDGAESEEG